MDGGASAFRRAAVTRRERTILKILLSEPDYLAQIQGKEAIFETDQGMRLFETVRQAASGGKRPNVRLLQDRMDDEDLAALQEVLDHTHIDPGRSGDVFRECLRDWEREKISARERELLAMLSMADEEENGEAARKLTEELMEVQRKLKEYR